MGLFRLKLQSKMLLLFSLVILVGIVGIGLMVNAINDMNTEMVDLATRSRNLADVTEVRTQIQRQHEAISGFAATENDAYLDTYLRAGQLASDALDRAIAAAEFAAAEDAEDETYTDEFESDREPVDELALLQSVQADIAVYDEKMHDLITYDWNEFLGPFEEHQVFLDERNALPILESEQARLEQIGATLDKVAYSYSLDLQQAAGFGEEITNNAIRFGVLVLLLFGVLALTAALVTNSIADPVLNLTNAVVAFENNQYRPEMLSEYKTRNDELGKLAGAVDHMAQSILAETQNQKRMLNAANRFVPISYVDFLAKDDITQIELGDHVSAQMPIMWTDIRSFSALSEKMTAAENFTFINDYLKTISPAIRENNGALVKFVGDGMLSVFPFGVEDAVQAAIAQFESVAAYNRQRAEQGLPSTGLSIGLHHGPMMLGMVGEATRMQGDAFSDNVNLTNRIEGLNKFFGSTFVMSQETLSQMEHPEAYEVRRLGSVRVKGRQTPLVVYEVMNSNLNESDRLKVETRDTFQQALNHWTRGDFAQAHPLFEQVAAANPKDVTATYYRDESAKMMREGAPKDWDGVLVMVSK